MVAHISKRFAITGVAGYIAPRHLKAMKALNAELTAAHDISDSVGIMDSYFPHAYFTTDADDFKRHLAAGNTDFLTVCTPNHLHCNHVIDGLQTGNDVICEKPLATTPEELRMMDDSRKKYGHNVWTILQLRHHPEIVKLRQAVENDTRKATHDIDLTYITPRGSWYAASWKGDCSKSGGLAANIGIHFIDMLNWIFGETEHVTMHRRSADSVAGTLYLKKARVRFFLSINPAHKPVPVANDMTPYRSMTIDGTETDFTNGFTDLHTVSYEHILKGKGFTIEDTAGAVATLQAINNTEPAGFSGDYHPLAKAKTTV